MIRAFIGIPLEDSVKKRLASILPDFGRVKLVEKENLHITLKYLGDIDEANLDNIKKCIDEAAAETEKISITINSIEAFPSVPRAKVMWAGIDIGAYEIGLVFKNLEESLTGIGFKKEERDFTAHVTVARTKDWIDISFTQNMNFIIPGTAGSLVLYKSKLTANGPVYEELYVREMGG